MSDPAVDAAQRAWADRYPSGSTLPTSGDDFGTAFVAAAREALKPIRELHYPATCAALVGPARHKTGEPCNTGKSSISPDADIVADVAEDALRWAAAMRVAAAMRAEKRAIQAELHAKFLAKWNSWTYTRGITEYTIPIPSGWETSVDRFIDAGLERRRSAHARVIDTWPAELLLNNTEDHDGASDR